MKGSNQGTKVSAGSVRADSSLCVLKPPKPVEVEEPGRGTYTRKEMTSDGEHSTGLWMSETTSGL